MIGIGGGFNSPLDGKFDWVEKTEALKGLPMQLVQQVAINGSDPMMKTLAVGEIDRRAKAQRAQMAQMAKPGQTVAQQIVGRSLGLPGAQSQQPGMTQPGQQMQAGIGALQQAMPGAAPQGPVGPPMEEGGPLSSDDLIRRMIAAAESARATGMESMPGAMDYVRQILGPARQQYESAINARAKREPDLRRRELSDRLAAMGTALMNYTGPNGLSALGQGFSALNQEQQEVNQARDARANQSVEDAAAMMGLDAQQLSTASGLYGVGREGLAGLREALQSGANILGQRDIARTYAAAQGSNQPSRALAAANAALRTAQSRENAARVALDRVRNGIPGVLNASNDPRVIARAEQDLRDAMTRRAILESRVDRLALEEEDGVSGGGDYEDGAGLEGFEQQAMDTRDPNRPRGARERWADYHRRNPNSARPAPSSVQVPAAAPTPALTPEQELQMEQGQGPQGWSVRSPY